MGEKFRDYSGAGFRSELRSPYAKGGKRMKKRKLKKFFMMMIVIVMLLLSFSQLAYASTKWNVEASENNYHYGCGSDVLVEQNPAIEIQKVNSIWTTRTDQSGWCEMGHYQIAGGSPQAFCAWGKYGDQLAMVGLSYVTPGSYVNYKIGYDYATYKHYFYMNGSLKYSISASEVNNMTSCWPVTNSEKDWVDNPSWADNNGCFSNLVYKVYNNNWTWSSWIGATVWHDDDSYWSNDFIAANHVDTVRDSW